MSILTGEPAVIVTRGPAVESVHSVAACVCDAAGTIVYRSGDITTPVFLRSSAKPFIAAAVMRSGARERYDFDEREIAVMCASHNGEPGHVAAAASILAKIGASVDDLACGATPPAYGPAAAELAARGERPTALHNNCSGKHAGILALARMLDAPLAGYLAVTHPAQIAILALCERLSDDRFDASRIGVDGCGIPVYATPLANAALSFARFADLAAVADDRDRAALAIVRDAMIHEPWYVGGTERFDSELMLVTGGRIACKAGAEGVHADALIDRGWGLVLKVVDGTRRAVPPATIAILRSLDALDEVDEERLAAHARPLVHNVAGAVVGEIRMLVDEPGQKR